MQKWVFDIRSGRFFVLLASFVILTFLVHAKITQPMDDAIITYAQSLGGNQALDLTMQILTEIGSVFYMIIFCIILFIKKKTRRLGLILILSVLAGTIASAYMKDFVGQERPKLEFAGKPFPIALEQDLSFFGILVADLISKKLKLHLIFEKSNA